MVLGNPGTTEPLCQLDGRRGFLFYIFSLSPFFETRPFIKSLDIYQKNKTDPVFL